MCLARVCPRNTWEKTTKNEQPGTGRPTPTAKPRARKPAPKPRRAGRTDERKGKHGSRKAPRRSTARARTNTNSHTHTHTHQDKREPGQETVKGREPMTSTREKRPTRGVAEDSREYRAHRFRRGRNQASHGSSRDDLGLLDAVRVVALRGSGHRWVLEATVDLQGSAGTVRGGCAATFVEARCWTTLVLLLGRVSSSCALGCWRRKRTSAKIEPVFHHRGLLPETRGTPTWHAPSDFW